MNSAASKRRAAISSGRISQYRHPQSPPHHPSIVVGVDLHEGGPLPRLVIQRRIRVRHVVIQALLRHVHLDRPLYRIGVSTDAAPRVIDPVTHLDPKRVTNLTTQDEQVGAFRNAATHLRAGGCFVIENYIPELQRPPPGQTTQVFTATPTHLGFEKYDVAAQIAISQHYWVVDGELKTFSSPHRYVWPAELDLMARLAGLTMRERWSGWNREPFTSTSRSHISVWEKPQGYRPGHPRR